MGQTFSEAEIRDAMLGLGWSERVCRELMRALALPGRLAGDDLAVDAVRLSEADNISTEDDDD